RLVVHQAGGIRPDTEGSGRRRHQRGRLELVTVGGEHFEAVPKFVGWGRRLLTPGQSQGRFGEHLVGPDGRRAAVPTYRVEAPLQGNAARTVVAQPDL